MREGEGAPIARRVTRLDPGHRARRQVGEQRVGRERGSIVQPHHQLAGAGHRRRTVLAAQLVRRATEDSAHRLVELSDAGESSRKGDVGHAQRGRGEQQSCALRAAGAGVRRGSDADFGGHQPVQMARADPKALGNARDTELVRHAVADQSQRAGDDIGSNVPVRCTRTRLRPAAPAGAEARGLRFGRRPVERDVDRVGRAGRTARSAEDPGGRDCCVETAVEPRVPAAHGLVASSERFGHVRIMRASPGQRWRISDADHVRGRARGCDFAGGRGSR